MGIGANWNYRTGVGTFPRPTDTARSVPGLAFQRCAKFFNSVYVQGAIASKDYALHAVRSTDPRLIASLVSGQPADGGQQTSAFAFQLLLSESRFLGDLPVTICFSGLEPMATTLHDIAAQAKRSSGASPRRGLRAHFAELIAADGYRRMLDIGGRARSGVLRADGYPGKEVVVLDVLPGEGVDVVCDVHCMSKVFTAAWFDIVFSFAVFEHLIMPWKAAIEMNRIMRVGAVGLIVTHQTVGMHDLPWDYFRFSDTAWRGLFNSRTGFEIIATELDDVQYIVPATYDEAHADAEKTAGFYWSSVLIRKVADTALDWPVRAGEVVQDSYPA